MARILFTLIGASSPGTQPLNVSILSSICNRAGHKTDLFDTTFMDMGFDLDTEVSQRDSVFEKIDYSKHNLIREKVDAKQLLIRKIKEFKPDIIAASAMSDMFYWTHRLLTYVKEEGYDIPVICGGIHSTLQPEDVMKHKCIDYNVIGEGEDILLPLIDDILNKKEPGPLTPVPVMYRKEGKIEKTINQHKLVDLNDLPYLNWDFYEDRQFYRPFMGKLLRSGDVQSMRGCPRKCSYCANVELNQQYAKMEGWKGWRTYTPERFAGETKYLATKHDLEFFKFYDEDMLLRPIDDMAKLAELYKKHVNIPFTMQCHPSTIKKEKIKLLADMGCASLTLSMECGNPHYRKAILKRSYSDDAFIKCIKGLNEVNLRSAALTMIGMPFESRKTIFETIELGRTAKATHTNTNIFFPYFGTPLGDMALKYKMCNENKVRKSKFDASRTLLNMPTILPEEVEGIRKMWSFYLTWPKFMFPLFRWFEKDTPIRSSILKIFTFIEEKRKQTMHHKDKNSKRAIDLVTKAQRREFPGNDGSKRVLDIEKEEEIFGTKESKHVSQFHNMG